MKNYFKLARRGRLLLLMLFALLAGGVSPAWADAINLPYSYGFENDQLTLEDGWTKYFGTSLTSNNNECGIVGDAKKTGSYGFRFSSYQTSGTNAQYLISPEFNAPNGVNVSFYYKASDSRGTEKFKVGYSTTDTDVASFTWGEENSTNSTGWLLCENNFPAGTKYVAIYYYSNYQYRLYVDDFSFTSMASGPALAVADGSTTINSGYNYDFGLTTAGATHYFILSNPGTESITLNIAATNGFGVSNSSLTLDAKGSSLLTVTMADATASGTVTITPTVSEVDPFVINVSGTIRDPNKVYIDFADGQIPEGWTSVAIGSYASSYGSPWAASTGYVSQSGSSSSYEWAFTSPLLNFEKDELIAFETEKYSTSSYYTPSIKVEYSLDGTTWTTIGSAYTDDVADAWTSRSVTIPVEGVKYIRFSGWYVKLRNIYGGQLPDGANFAIDTDGTTQNFGVAAIDGVAEKTFTITNSGNAALSVTITAAADFSVNNTKLSVPAKSGDTNGTASFTVSMSTVTAGLKSGNIELAFNALNASSFTIPVSGVVMPEGATVVDFNDNALPAGWGNNASYKWSFADGKASCTSAAELTTSKLQFEEGDFFIISATSYDDYDNNYIEIYTSTDGTTWGTNPIKKFVSRSQIPYGSYVSLVVTDIPTTVKFLKFKGYYVRIDEITGLKFDANDPRLAVTSDAEGNNEVAVGTTCDLGWVTDDTTATYYIKNAGTGTLTISEITAPAGITAATVGNATTVASGATLALTITMAAEDNLGYHSGNVVITTDGGNFTLPVSGLVRKASKLYLDFSADDASFPAGWSTGNWTITGGTAKASGTLQTTVLIADANENMYIEAISNADAWSSASLDYSYSIDNGTTWTSATDLDGSLSTSAYKTIPVNFTITELSSVLVKFTGSNVSVRRIYGFTPVAVAVMTTTATDIAFGMQTEESAEQSFTITNDGTAELMGLALSLGKTGSDAEYSFRMTDSEDAEFTGSTLAAGATITVHVKQLFDINKLGGKSDVLTIAATDQVPVAINLTGTTRDPSKLYVDFSDNSWPAGWQHGDWTVSYGEAISTNDYSSIVTTPLTVADGDKLSFDVKRTSSSASGRDLIVRYTTDGGMNWTAYDWSNYDWSATETLKDQITSSYNTFEIVNIPAGTVAFEFSGKYVKLDNIQADYTLTTAPLMAFTTVEDNITGANLKADATATYTLANNGNADYVATVAATNVTAEATGNGVTFESNTLTIPAGKTATITVTMAFAAPYGEKTGNLSITSDSWVGDITANYTANLVDPTDFVEDFSGNDKPAGWFSENWVYDGGTVHIYQGVPKPIITEKIGAEASSGRNVLKFDAKINGGTDEQTLNVYTSTDRKTWSEPQTFTLNDAFQTFPLTPLADGEYYVKFESPNASIDNLTGVKKLALPEHDLYLVSATLPTDEVTPNKAISATVNVASLITTETVGAELYFGENIIGVLTDQEVTTAATKAITITGHAPVAGTYDVYAKVYNDNVAIETDKVSVTVADTRKLQITGFPYTAAAQADDDNEFTATLNVTVQNTGTVSLAANDVSVTLTDTSDSEKTFTATWTAENSNVLYMNTKKDETDIADGCTLMAWCWNTDEDGVWSTFTNISDGFWSVDLQNKTNFKICCVNPAAPAEISEDDILHESGELSLANGNLAKFSDYGEGKAINFSQETMTALEPSMTTTLKVTVSGAAGTGRNVSYKATENVSNTTYSLNCTVSVTATMVDIAINEYGCATFADEHALDLDMDNLPAGLKVLYATADNVNDGYISMTNATGKVKARTGLLVKGSPNTTYQVYATKKSEAAELAGNLLVGCVAETTLEADASLYVLVGEGGSAEFQSLSQMGATIPAGKAYLDATSVSGAGARLVINFDSETTGVVSMDNGKWTMDNEAGAWYDLQGRPVERSMFNVQRSMLKKGVYIRNGRKVVIK